MSLHGRIAVIQRHTRVPVELEQPPERTDLRRREISGSSARFSPYASPSPRRRLGRINPRMWIRPKLVQALRARDWPSLPRPRLTLGREPTLAPSNVRREGRPKSAKTVPVRGLSDPGAPKSPKNLRRFCPNMQPQNRAKTALHRMASVMARQRRAAQAQSDELLSSSYAARTLPEGRAARLQRSRAAARRGSRPCSAREVGESLQCGICQLQLSCTWVQHCELNTASIAAPLI